MNMTMDMDNGIWICDSYVVYEQKCTCDQDQDQDQPRDQPGKFLYCARARMLVVSSKPPQVVQHEFHVCFMCVY
jgi:hypothetical protein